VYDVVDGDGEELPPQLLKLRRRSRSPSVREEVVHEALVRGVLECSILDDGRLAGD